jgi:hypothetical protein
MANKRLWLVAPVIALVLGMTVVGCKEPDSGGGNTDPKTLIVTSVPPTVLSGATTVLIGVYPVGTSKTDAIARTGIVAGADQDAITTNDTTLTILLYIPIQGTTTRWTGSGTYDIWVMVNNTTFYKASSVSITQATTSIPWSRVTSQ